MEGFWGLIFLIVIAFFIFRAVKKRRLRQLKAISIFQYEIKRLHIDGEIDDERYNDLLRKSHIVFLDLMDQMALRRTSNKWRNLRDEAWHLIEMQTKERGIAPWRQGRSATPKISEPKQKPLAARTTAVVKAKADPLPAPVNKDIAQESLNLEQAKTPTDSTTAKDTTTSKTETKKAQPKPQIPAVSKPQKQREYALKPTEPSELELWLKKAAGIPALMAPFLMQNIGWFIGGFLFLAGTVFLVFYTSGFTKALVVFLALFAYALFLFWAAYQLRKTRPELIISSRVLAILAVLLIPLTLASNVRLIDASAGSVSLALISLAMGIGGLVLFWIYANVVSTVIHSSLKGGHPKLFLLISAIQLSSLVLNRLPSVYLFALFQLSILALLAWSVRLYAQTWLKSIFDDHEHISYYAMGTLAYAALISFAHISLSEVEVGSAYYGPFLMCFALFVAYIDVQFKQWRDKYVALSRFNFVVYGLAGLALILSLPEDWALSISLILGMCIFAWIAYQHLSTPPLVLFLSMAAWLYYVNILKLFAIEYHLLLSLPGIALLFWVSHWLGKKKVKLSYHLYLITGGLMSTLLGFSLSGLNSSWINFISCISAFFISYYMLRHFPLWQEKNKSLEFCDQKNSNWNYLVLSFLGLSMLFLPQLASWQNQEQWIILLTLLATVCSVYALWLWRRESAPHLQIQTLCNFSILLLLLNLVLATTTHVDFLILSYFSAGILLMILALGLFSRSLIYISMVLLMAGIFTFRQLYLPGPRSGLGPVTLGLASWILLWWLNRKCQDSVDAKSRETIYLFGFYKIKGPQ